MIKLYGMKYWLLATAGALEIFREKTFMNTVEGNDCILPRIIWVYIHDISGLIGGYLYKAWTQPYVGIAEFTSNKNSQLLTVKCLATAPEPHDSILLYTKSLSALTYR